MKREKFLRISNKRLTKSKIVVAALVWAAGKIFKLLFDMKNSSHRPQILKNPKVENFRQFRHRPFIFKNQDQESYIRSEINHIRRLIYAFRAKIGGKN